MVIFSGKVKDWKNHVKNNVHEFSAGEFDGTAWYEFNIENGKPLAIEFDSEFNAKDMQVLIHLEDNVQAVTPGKCVIDLNGCNDGQYKFVVTAKNAKNFHVKFKFI